MDKKGQAYGAVAGVTGLVSLAIVFVIYAIVSSYGAEIVSDTGDDFAANSVEYNITQNSLSGIDATAEKMPTVGRIVVAAIIITVILAAFGGFVAMR